MTNDATGGPRRVGQKRTGSDGEVRSYYGRPVVKEPEWTWEVPWYLFAGGTAGASSALAAVARLTGNERLAHSASTVAALGGLAGPALLVADLGRPQRFLNMLRVFKPTSAMSVGSWILAGYTPAAVGTALLGRLGAFPVLQRVAECAAGLLGLPMTTYTGVLVADTSIPVWHEARRELPWLFAASGAATAAAAVVLLTPVDAAAPARRLAVGGALTELAVGATMERRLGDLGDVYTEGDAGRYERAAKGCTALGGVAVAVAGTRRWGRIAGSALLLVGGICQRWAVYRAGFQSAWDPEQTIGTQRERLRRGEGHRTGDRPGSGGVGRSSA